MATSTRTELQPNLPTAHRSHAVRALVQRALEGGRIDDVLRLDLTVFEAVQALVVLRRAGWIDLRDGCVAPTESGRLRASSSSTWSGVLTSGLARDALDWNAVAATLASRPYTPDPAMFQSFDTLVSLQQRLAVLLWHRDLVDRTFLQLGDDEMFAAMVARTGEPLAIHVADSDHRILDAIASDADSAGRSTIGHLIDVRFDAPLRVAADTVFVSGLKDAGGLMLFVTHAILASAGAGAVLYVSFDPSVYRPGLDVRAATDDTLKRFAALDCSLTMLVPCDAQLLTDETLVLLGDLVIDAAEQSWDNDRLVSGLTSLGKLGGDLLHLKHGFPHTSLGPCPLARLMVGPESKRLAGRQLRMLQSAVRQ